MPWKPFHVEERGVAQILKHQFHFQPPTSLITPTQTGATFIFLKPDPKQGTLQPKNILFSYLVEQIMLRKKKSSDSVFRTLHSRAWSPSLWSYLPQCNKRATSRSCLQLHCFLHFIHLPLLKFCPIFMSSLLLGHLTDSSLSVVLSNSFYSSHLLIAPLI